MVLKLYIWGPAFGLPSIDPECVAAVAYLSRVLSPEEWLLVVAYDPSTSPNGDFPVLDDASHIVTGYRAIVTHLQDQGYSLDTHLTPRQRADSVALSVHIQANAAPLIASTFYASSQNYTSTTRPAFTKILPAHTSYIVPPARRSAAIAQAGSLGLTSLDLDDTLSDTSGPTPPTAQQQAAERDFITTSPSLLFRQKSTVHAALAQQQSRNRFRIDSLVAHLLEPFTALLGSKPYIFSETGPTSTDCLAFGYLALLLYPQVPYTPIADTISKTFSTVADYTNRLRLELFQSAPFDVETIMRSPLVDTTPPPPTPTTLHLPWRTTPRPALHHTLSDLLTAATHHLIPPQHLHLLSIPTTTDRHLPLLPLLSALSLPVVGALSWFVYSSFYPRQPEEGDRVKVFRRDGDSKSGESGKGLGRWGDAGRVLGGAFGGGEEQLG